MSQVHFLDLFLGYEPPEAIRPAVEALTLDHADLDREARTISLYLTSDCYLPEQSLEGMASELESRYGLKRLALSVQYPPEALATFDYHDLYRVFVKCYSPSAAILAGANYVLEGETLTIHLRANGKNELLSHLPRAERFLEERFGVHISIAVEAHSSLEGKALFEETYPDVKVYVDYEIPYFIVSAGNCLTKEEAIMLKGRVSATFPKAFLKQLKREKSPISNLLDQ